MFKFFARIFKLILLPSSIKQQKTMKKTAKIQKKMKEIQDKYSNDPVRLNQEVRDLYAEEKMSPFSRLFELYFTNYNCNFNVFVSK